MPLATENEQKSIIVECFSIVFAEQPFQFENFLTKHQRAQNIFVMPANKVNDMFYYYNLRKLIFTQIWKKKDSLAITLHFVPNSIYSFKDSYSASSKILLSGAPDSSTVERNSCITLEHVHSPKAFAKS